MTIKEFKKVVNIISKTAELEGLWNNINQLRTHIVQYNSQKQTNPQNIVQLRNNLDSFRIQVLNSITNIYKKIIESDELNNFNKLNLDGVFGEEAIEFLKDLIYNVESKFTETNQSFTNFQTKISHFQNLENTLNQIIGNSETEEKEEQENIVVVYFENGADIKSLKQLSKSTNEWNQIVNFMGRLVKENDNETQIISIRRGSLILKIGAAHAIVYALTKSFDKVLDLILKVYEIKKKSLELKELKHSNLKHITDLMDKEARLNVGVESEKISNELLKEFNWNVEDTLYNETKTSIEQAVRKIIRFSNSGGKIETKLLTPTDDEEAIVVQLTRKTNLFREEEAKIIKLQGVKEFLQLDDKEDDTTNP